MGEKTGIQWTDATWNPIRGCTQVSPGCAHCYAKTFAERFRGVPNHPFTQGFDLRLVPEKLELPLHWKEPRRIFVNSMSDLYHEDVPEAYIRQVFAPHLPDPHQAARAARRAGPAAALGAEHLAGRQHRACGGSQLGRATDRPLCNGAQGGRTRPS